MLEISHLVEYLDLLDLIRVLTCLFSVSSQTDERKTSNRAYQSVSMHKNVLSESYLLMMSSRH